MLLPAAAPSPRSRTPEMDLGTSPRLSTFPAKRWFFMSVTRLDLTCAQRGEGGSMLSGGSAGQGGCCRRGARHVRAARRSRVHARGRREGGSAVLRGRRGHAPSLRVGRAP